MKRFILNPKGIAELFHYADTWALVKHPDYQRKALVCKTRALMYLDRKATQ